MPDQTVHGTVIIDANEPIKARNVTLQVVGQAHTHWKCKHMSTYYNPETKTTEVNRGIVKESESHPARGIETYMDNKFVLWDGSDKKMLPAGIHKLNFVFPLPHTCPPSYEGEFGYIRYYCKAKIDRPWQFDKTVIAGFTVLPHFDLNTIPHAANPRASIPKYGYVPGESIDIQMDFLNESSRKIDCIDVKLIEYTIYTGKCDYTSHRARKEHDRTVNQIKHHSKIQAKTSGSEILSLKVPPIVPSFHNCSIIQVDYILKVNVDAHGFMNNTMSFNLPILIGTYPIIPRAIESPAYPMAPPDYVAPPQSTVPPEAIFGPPPSYAICKFGQGTVALYDKDAKNAENFGFAPRYLYYNSGIANSYPALPELSASTQL
uniref:Arrestin C-terminal-like domain-containing protein n=1 Tax=Acrobeloides nanus TaxID=290746 RepID=A0A914DQK0_9BILA